MFRNIWRKHPVQPTRRRPVVLQVEQLETRLTPAWTVVDPFTATYTDVDNDLVSVKLSQPVMSGIFPSFPTTGQLGQLFVDGMAATINPGLNITISVKTQAGGGNGLVNVGEIRADGLDLGAVSVNGDLGRIRCGSSTAGATALKSLSVASLGGLGTSSGAPDLQSQILGSMGTLKVAESIFQALVHVAAGGNLKSVSVGGSIYGGSAVSTGEIYAEGNLGRVTVTGDLFGDDGGYSGAIVAGLAVGPVSIGGTLNGGVGNHSGSVSCGYLAPASLGKVKVGGALLGGDGEYAGSVSAPGSTLKGLTVGTFVANGNGIGSGSITGLRIGSVTITGNLSGPICADKDIKSIRVKGNILGVDAYAPVYISAAGEPTPTATRNLAIKKLTVDGDVSFALICAGYDPFFFAVNADAQIGAIKVGGNWIASNVLAGVEATNLAGVGLDPGTTKMGGAVNDEAALSRIGSVKIDGQVHGDGLGAGGESAMYWGFAAEQIGSFKYNGLTITLLAGPDSDTFASSNEHSVGSDLLSGSPDGFAVHVFEV